jgi:electron transfer flavoprotein alpha/beta subunit
MKIAVAVKAVPDAAGAASRSYDEASRPSVELAISDFDVRGRGGAEAQGSGGEGEVVVVSMGPNARWTRAKGIGDGR